MLSVCYLFTVGPLNLFEAVMKEKASLDQLRKRPDSCPDFFRPRYLLILLLLGAMPMMLLLTGCGSDASSKTSAEARAR